MFSNKAWGSLEGTPFSPRANLPCSGFSIYPGHPPTPSIAAITVLIYRDPRNAESSPEAHDGDGTRIGCCSSARARHDDFSAVIPIEVADSDRSVEGQR